MTRNGLMKLNKNALVEMILKMQEENERVKEELKREKQDFKETNDYCFELKSRIDKAIDKLERTRLFGLRSGKTLISTLINETIDILQGGK